MQRQAAHDFTRQKLAEYKLTGWHVRMSLDDKVSFLGLCIHKDKVIMLNAHHVDIHPDWEVKDTILHEVAHAIVGPLHGHDKVWEAKAIELGAKPEACSHLTLPAHVIDAIRSGQTVEMIEEEVVVKKVKFEVTQLKDRCPECGKVAKELFAFEYTDPATGDAIKLITLECFHVVTRRIPKGTAFDTMVSNDWKPEVKNCKHDWPTDAEVDRAIQLDQYIASNQCRKCGEFKLFPFQVIGALATETGIAMQKGFGIFDDMGLGKTVQALAIIKFHPKEYTPTMYVVKSAITFNWLKQILRWLGPDFLGQIIKSGRDFIMPGLKTYIISYDLLRRMKREKIEALGIKLVVLDECQQIKNPDSTRTQEVRRLVSNPKCKVIALSGTPWKNRGSEFFSVLNMMDPIKFHSYQYYLDTWVDYYYQGNQKKMGGIRRPAKFREYTSGLLIRREYDEVMKQFPAVNRMKLPVQLDELSQSAYDDEESEFVKWYNEAVIGGEEENILSGVEILGKLSRMRHITGLAKIPATLGFVEEFIEDTDKKLVIFVHHQDVGRLILKSLTETDSAKNPDFHELAQSIKDANIPVMKMTAEFTDGERYSIGETFNGHKRAIMVASTLACGEGIDLQTCADCVMHERQWNPQNEDQAAPGRFKRIGQLAKQVNITFAEAEGTVDEHLNAIVEQKRLSFHKVMNKGEAPKWVQSEIIKALVETIMIKHKAKNANRPKPVKSLTTIAAY